MNVTETLMRGAGSADASATTLNPALPAGPGNPRRMILHCSQAGACLVAAVTLLAGPMIVMPSDKQRI
jgi:hypothetical protein